MPFRQPASPLVLETCSQVAPDLEDGDLIGSDDDLDEGSRTAQHHRIEKLAETYLQGAPLFILSASLRGPLDRGWVNPWKKDRRKTADGRRHNAGIAKAGTGSDSRVIPETNSRKRPQYQISQEARSRQLTVPLTPSEDPNVVTNLPSRRLSTPYAVGSGKKSYNLSHLNSSDRGWLRKDRVSARFRNINPPTSPTPSSSSLHARRNNSIDKKQLTKNKNVVSNSKPPRLPRATSDHIMEAPLQKNYPTGDIASTEQGPTLALDGQEMNTDHTDRDTSIQIISSSSQLPKFEYRRKKFDRNDENSNLRNPIGFRDRELSKSKATSLENNSPTRHLEEVLRMSASRSHDGDLQPKDADDQDNPQDSLTLTNASGTIDNPSASNLDQESPSNLRKTFTSENLPSAQLIRGNPHIPDYVTSLHSISISKRNSNHAEENYQEPQFSTQAALMVAQKSFQNDLNTPEHSPMLSRKKRRASQTSNPCSPKPVDITPFHHMNTPNRATTQLQAPETAGAQVISTQYMIDAVTPFTFSTDKRIESRVLSSTKSKSISKKRKTASFASSPSPEIILERPNSGDETNQDFLPTKSSSHENLPVESQPSGLPMTLSGATPPTAQDGHGAGESFNLSQAIAEAGTWLQQSFEINNEIKQCWASGPHSAADTDFLALNLDGSR